MDDPLSTTGNHLTREIKAAFCDATLGVNGQEKIDRIPRIYHGAAGLGSRDVRPGDIIIIATFTMLSDAEARLHQPRVVLLDENNHIKDIGREVPGPARREC